MNEDLNRLYLALQNAHNAGDTNAARTLAQEIRRIESISLNKQQPTQQQPIQQQPVISKPVEKEEEQSFFERTKNAIKTLAFSKEEKPEPQPQERIVQGLQDYKASIEGTKTPELQPTTLQELSEGFKPKTNIITSSEDVLNKYRPEYKKSYSDITNLWNYFFSNEKPLTAEDFTYQNLNKRLNEVSPDNLTGNSYYSNANAIKTFKNELEKLKNIDVKKTLEINTIKAQNKSNNLYKLNPDEKIEKINVLENSVSKLKEKNKNLQEENIVDKVPASNPVTYLFNLWGAYQKKSSDIAENNRKIKLGNKNLFYAKGLDIDLDKTLAKIPENERIQTEAILDPELKGLLNSAQKFKDREDETSSVNLIDKLTNKESKDIKVKGYTAEKNLENLYNKVAETARLRKDLLNETYKDDLQDFIVANNFQNLFNVNDEKFNYLIDNYSSLRQNPESLNLLFNDPTAAEKFRYIETNSDFNKILTNTIIANTVNDERVNYRLNKFLDDKKNSLNALNYIKALGENQQLAEDYLEQKAQESGILSFDNAKFLASQAIEKGNYIKEFSKQIIGTLASKVSSDDDWRKLEYSSDLFKAINNPTDIESLSPFSNAKWIELKTTTNNDYKVAVDPNGNVVDVRYNKFSIPVKGPMRDQITDYFYKNKETLLKDAKNITDYQGGYTANAGYLASQIVDEGLEEVPTAALEIGLAAASRGSLGAGLAVASKIPKIANWANKLKNSGKFINNYNKLTGNMIGYTSAYSEIAHDVQRNYEERGLDPNFLNTALTSGGMAAVAQLTPALEKTYRKFGTDLAENAFKKEAKEVFITDIPKVLPLLSESLNNIGDKKLKDYLLQKEVREYAVGRFIDRTTQLVKPFAREGVQESLEETVLEPLSQIVTNSANAALTGNELYNKESLQDLGFLDPETALIAGLTGGVMASGINTISNAMSKDYNSMDALQAAVNDPTKFKALLGSFVNDQNESGKNLTPEQYNSVINNFDNLRNNYNKTKEEFNLTSDFATQTNLENPVIQNTLKTLGLNPEAFNEINGTKTLSNIILNNELNNLKKQESTERLQESIGIPDNNGNKNITQFLDQNGLFNSNKYSEITGDTNIDSETSKIITNYNTAQAEDLKLKNTLNLFSKNFAGIQSTYLNNYQDIITDNPDLTSPDLSFFNNILKNKLYNQSINNQRIAQIEQELSQFETVEKDKTLKNELTQLKQTNGNIQKEINNITSTYKKGYLETQNNLSALEQEYNYVKGSVDSLLESYATSDTDTLTEEDEEELNKLIALKSQKLSNLIKAFKDANKKYNNGIIVKTLKNKVLETKSKEAGTYNIIIDKDFQEDLKKEIKSNKEALQKIKKYKYLFNKFKTSSLTPEELNEFRKFNKTYDEQQVLKTILPYFVSLTKEEIEVKLSNNTDLTLALFNNLINLGYINFNRLGKNISPELMLSQVQNALLELNYNIALINDNRLNEIKLFSKQNGALFVNSLIEKIEINNKTNKTATEGATSESINTEIDVIPTISESFETIQKPTIKGSNKQEESLNLLERNSIKRSALPAENITDNFYIIDNKLYQRVTTVEEEKKTSSEYLTAGSNVGNFLDNVGRIIFGNNNINETHKEEVYNTLINNFANKNVELSIDKERYNRMFKFLLDRRNDLISKGYIFVTDERVIYSKYDGTDFTGIESVTMPDNTVGIAGTMDIIAIAPNGKIDILDLKSVSDNKSKANTNASNYKKTKWAKQLGIYKTILEKIPGITVDNLKVLRFNVTYDILNLGNKIINLNFKESSLENIFLSPTLQNTINKYLSIPSLIIATNPTNVDLTPEIPLVSDNDANIIELPNEVNDLLFFEDFNDNSEIPEDQVDFINYIFNEEGNEQVDPIIETIPFFEDEEGFEYDPNDSPGIETIEAVSPVLEIQPLELEQVTATIEIEIDSNTQLISGEADKETFQANSVQYSDDPNSNIVDLGRYTYVKYNTITDPVTNQVKYIVEVFNNQDLNKPFKNKEFTKEELKKEFNKQSLFFTDKINNNSVYLLLTANKKPINSFLLDNVINEQLIPISTTIDTVNYQDLEGQEGEIVLLNFPQYHNSFKTQEEFKNKASLGVIVNGQLVALIPSLTNNNKNALLRNDLIITGSKGNFSVEPFKVKIDKVKAGSIIFNQDNQPVVNFMSNLPGFTSTLAYVGEVNKVKQLINPFGKSNEERNLIIDASNLTKAGVYLILEKPNKNPIIIPLNTPTLKEYIGTIKPEQLANLKTFLSENLTFNSKKSIKDNYLDFLNQLNDLVTSNPRSGVLKNLYNAIPKSINDKPTSNKQIKNIANLKLNFNLDTLFDYLLDTLINLNEVTKQFYTIDVDSQNLYADNSVIISYNKAVNNAVIIDNKQSVEFFKDFSDDTFCD